jgi:hypothetical protein
MQITTAQTSAPIALPFHRDIHPSLDQQILDTAEVEGEAKVRPYRRPDDVRRELVASE